MFSIIAFFGYRLHSTLVCISFGCTAQQIDIPVGCKVQPAPSDTSGAHPAPQVVVTILLTILPTLYFPSPGLCRNYQLVLLNPIAVFFVGG